MCSASFFDILYSFRSFFTSFSDVFSFCILYILLLLLDNCAAMSNLLYRLGRNGCPVYFVCRIPFVPFDFCNWVSVPIWAFVFLFCICLMFLPSIELLYLFSRWYMCSCINAVMVSFSISLCLIFFFILASYTFWFYYYYDYYPLLILPTIYVCYHLLFGLVILKCIVWRL